MNLPNFKGVFTKENFKTGLTISILASIAITINTVSLSQEEKQSALEVAYVAVDGLSKKIPCNSVNLLTMNMLGEKNRVLLAEKVRVKVKSDLETAYDLISERNTEGHSNYYWWYSEWRATDALDQVVDKCFGL